MDFAQLGLDAAQLVKLSDIASSVREIEAMSEARERREQELNKKRQMALLAEQLLDKLADDSSLTPQRRYLYTLEIERTLERSHVLPASAQFGAWSDLDRIAKLEAKLSAAREQFGAALAAQERKEADSAWQFMLEDFDLCWLIRRRSQKEELAELRQKQETLSAPPPGSPHRLTKRALRAAIKGAEARLQAASECGDPESDAEAQEELIRKFGESSARRLVEMRQSRRELVRRILGAKAVATLEAEQREEEEEEQPKNSTAVPLPVPAAMAVMVVLSAIACGLVYGGMNVSGLIGQPSGKDEGDYFVGCLLILFGGAAFVAGIQVVFRSIASAVRQHSVLPRDASIGEK